MGAKASKNNKIKSHDLVETPNNFREINSASKQTQKAPKHAQHQATPFKSNEMVLFHKSAIQNRSFVDDEADFMTDSFLTQNNTQPEAKQQEQSKEESSNSNVESSPTLFYTPITSAKQNRTTDTTTSDHTSFIKIKSRSDLSTRQISFAYDSIPSEDTFLDNAEELFNQREKSKFNVRFADKVLVMNSSDLDKFWLSRTQPIQIVDMDKIDKYFINLNDEKLTSKIPRISKMNRSVQRDKGQRRFMQTKSTSEFKNEFEKLRSWNIIKENTFYEDVRSVASIPSIG